MLRKVLIVSMYIAFTAMATSVFAAGQDWKSGIPWQKPPVVTPADQPGAPPSDAVVLFNGKDTAAWEKNDAWKIENGELIGGRHDLVTKQKFGSVQLHVEFAIQNDIQENGQGRGNSGIFLGNYEVQVLDNFSPEGATYYDGQCGAIYKQCAPLVNVCKKPGDWQTYDIIFNRPELKIDKVQVAENGDEKNMKEETVVTVLRPAYITVIQNGVLIINHHEIKGTTYYDRPPAYEAHADLMPIHIQDHGNAPRFRNIWVREIPDADWHPEPVKPAYYK